MVSDDGLAPTGDRLPQIYCQCPDLYFADSDTPDEPDSECMGGDHPIEKMVWSGGGKKDVLWNFHCLDCALEFGMERDVTLKEYLKQLAKEEDDDNVPSA